MNTFTITVEDKKMIPVLRKLLSSINGVSIVPTPKTKRHNAAAKQASQANRYYISPRIKALETCFTFPEDISEDYKKEINEIRARKYS